MRRQEPTPESARGAESATELERPVLGALCMETSEGPVKALARSLLADYPWREAVHAAVFEIVMSFPAARADLLREQLPARLTRRGFPDFDIACLFDRAPCSEKEAAEWIRRLRELPEEKR